MHFCGALMIREHLMYDIIFQVDAVLLSTQLKRKFINQVKF